MMKNCRTWTVLFWWSDQSDSSWKTAEWVMAAFKNQSGLCKKITAFQKQLNPRLNLNRIYQKMNFSWRPVKNFRAFYIFLRAGSHEKKQVTTPKRFPALIVAIGNLDSPDYSRSVLPVLFASFTSLASIIIQRCNPGQTWWPYTIFSSVGSADR